MFINGRITMGMLQLSDGTAWIGSFRFNQPFGRGKWVKDGCQQEGLIVEVNPPEQNTYHTHQNTADEDIEKEIQDEAEQNQ